MVGRNDEFMEAYKHLDKICREIFKNEKGITTYIDEMEAKRSGAFYVGSWDATLRKLKEYRHIRNAYVHEVGTSDLEICGEEDINWLKGFYEDIMQRRDPLAQYRSVLEQNKNKRVPKVEIVESAVTRQTSSFQEKDSHNIDLTIIIVSVLGIAGFILFFILLIGVLLL